MRITHRGTTYDVRTPADLLRLLYALNTIAALKAA